MPRGKVTPQHIKDKAKKMFEAGKRVEDIMAKLKVGKRSTIFNWSDKYGWSKRFRQRITKPEFATFLWYWTRTNMGETELMDKLVERGFPRRSGVSPFYSHMGKLPRWPQRPEALGRRKG